MVTNETHEPEPTKVDAAVEIARSAIAGHPQGAVRRILLYILTAALVLSPVPAAAVLPLFLLASTDQLA